MGEKKLLFSLTRKDFVVQTFCTGGNGGQHRNAKQNGVRIIHPASGARAEHRDGRDQAKNKQEAFRKLVATEEFARWHRATVAKMLGHEALSSSHKTEEELKHEVEAEVEKQMSPENLLVEYYDPNSGV